MIYSPAELERLIACAGTGFGRTVLTLLSFTGLRVGEALGLQWGDVEFATGRLFVRRQLDAPSQHV